VERTREVETKLEVPPGFVVPDLAQLPGVVAVEQSRHRMRTTYWDAPGLPLLGSGTSLRHRIGEGRPCWTLKQDAAEGGRWELTVPAPGTRVPVELRAQVVARLRGAALQPVVELRTVRTKYLLLGADARELAELVDDTVVVHGGTGASWRELEVEHRSDVDVAESVVAMLVASGAEVGEQVGKVRRALGDPPESGARRPMAVVRRRDASGDFLRAVLLAAQDLVVQHDEGVRRGTDDAVHQLRVACRTLRSQLRTFDRLLDDPRADALRDELRWVGEVLGRARDLEVLRARVNDLALRSGPAVDVSSLDEVLDRQHSAALQEGVAAMSSPRYVEAMELLHAVVAAPRLTRRASKATGKALPQLVRHEWKQLQRTASRLRKSSTDHDWHRARIRAKRARYASESVADVLGAPFATRAHRAKQAQTLLGRHQDAVVASTWLAELRQARPELAEVCSELLSREGRQAKRARKAFVKRRPALRLT
jgi:CHAD domain-containing protein